LRQTERKGTPIVVKTDSFNLVPGFVERSQTLYMFLGSYVLQSIIEEHLKSAPDPKEKLIRQLENLAGGGGESGTYNIFLDNTKSLNWEQMLSQMDITLCSGYLLNTDVRLTREEIQAIHAVRKGRNLDSHKMNTAAYAETELYTLWTKNRDALLQLTRVFPKHIPSDILTQIQGYYKGTAGPYRPPAKSVEKTFAYAIQDGRIEEALNALMGTSLVYLAKEPAAKHAKAYCQYIDSRYKSGSQKLQDYAKELITVTRMESTLFALRYANILPSHQDAAIFLAQAANGNLKNDDIILWSAAEQHISYLRPNDREVLFRKMTHSFPNWRERLYLLQVELDDDEAEARAHVRLGVLTGEKKLIRLFEEARYLHMDDIREMDWVNPTPQMEAMATSEHFPDDFRFLCRETERTQVLARLAKDLEGDRKSRQENWLSYQENRHIVNSSFPEVQEAAHNFGTVVGREYWSHALEVTQTHFPTAHTPESREFMEYSWGGVENGKVICRPKSKVVPYISDQLPEYDAFREAWLKLRTLCSQTFWAQERERIAAAARMPYGAEKMAVAPEQTHAPCMDTELEEHRLYLIEWDDFVRLRSREYWQAQIEALAALRTQPYSKSLEEYTRDTSYDHILAPCPDERKAWEEAHKQFRQELLDARYQLARTELTEDMARMRKTHKEVAPQLQKVQDFYNQINIKRTTPEELDAFEAQVRPLSERVTSHYHFNKSMQVKRYHALAFGKKEEKLTPEEKAFRDLYPQIKELCEILEKQREEVNTLRNSCTTLRREYQDYLKLKAQQEQDRKAAARAMRLMLTLTLAASVVVGLFLGGRFLLTKAVVSMADSKVNKGDLVSAYSLLDKTTFLDDEVEARRQAVLSTIRQTMLDNGFRQQQLDQLTWHSTDAVVEDAGLDWREDITPVPSNTYAFLVYQVEGDPAYYYNFHNDHPMKLRIPKGLTLSMVWGRQEGNYDEVYALCTDGTVLRGEVGWTFHLKYAEPAWYDQQYAKIAAQGMDMEIVDYLEDVRAVIHQGSDYIYHWMEDGRLMLGDICVYENAAGFLLGHHGYLSIDYALEPNGRLALRLDHSYNRDCEIEDIWEYGNLTVMKDGRIFEYSYSEGKKENDALFANIPDVTYYGYQYGGGKFLSVYDDAVEEWL